MSKEDTRYFYIKADPDHHDLEDIFKGKYIKNRKEWRFDKTQEKEVTMFLYCSSSESEEGLEDKFDRSDSEDDLQISDDARVLLTMKRLQRDRLHRANSFNASDSSDEEHESIDGDYRRSRISKHKITMDVNKLKKDLEKMDDNKEA